MEFPPENLFHYESGPVSKRSYHTRYMTDILNSSRCLKNQSQCLLALKNVGKNGSKQH